MRQQYDDNTLTIDQALKSLKATDESSIVTPQKHMEEGNFMQDDAEKKLEQDDELDHEETVDINDEQHSSSAEQSYTDEDVDEIVQKRIKRLERKHRRELEAAQRSAQNEDLSEVEQLKQQLESYQQNEVRREREKEVREVFQLSELQVDDSLVAGLIREDEDETIDLAEGIIELVRNEVQKVKKQQARRNPPTDASAVRKEENTKEDLATFAKSNRLVKD